MNLNSIRRRLAPLALVVVFVLLMITTSIKATDEFEPIKNEVMQMKKEGRHDDVLRLQANMKQQIDEKYRAQLADTPKVSGKTGSSSRSRHSGHEKFDRRRLSPDDEDEDSPRSRSRVHDHLEDRHRRRRDDSRNRQLGPPMTDDQRKKLMKGLSDERSVYHMEQSHKKSGILHHKLGKGEGTFTQEELVNYHDMIEQYLQLEKIVATFLQKTSEDYEKARSISDRDERQQYLSNVKAAWDLRKPQEKAARDAARDSFLQIKNMLEGHLGAHSEL